jgi:hypothetical protein
MGELEGEWEKRARDQVGEPEGEEVVAKQDQLRALINGAFEEPVEEAVLAEGSLVRLLRCSQWSPEAALQLLLASVQLVRDFPSYLQPLAACQAAAPLVWVAPARDPTGGRVLFLRLGRWQPSAVPVASLFSFMVRLCQLLSTEPRTQVGGITIVTDLAGFGFRHLTALGLQELRCLGTFLSGGFPLRFTAIHFVNNPRLFNTLYALLKGFLSESIANAVRFHGSDPGALAASVPAALLPRDLGGECEQAEHHAAAGLAALQAREGQVAAGLDQLVTLAAAKQAGGK